MKIKKWIKSLDLKSQLLIITSFSLIISFISLVIILPNLLTPFYEKNIYELLNQSLSLIEDNTKNVSSNVVFIIKSGNRIYASQNFNTYFNNEDIDLVISYVNNNQGKFKLNGQTYYYNSLNKTFNSIITLTDDSYILSQKTTLSYIIFPVISITIIIITLVLSIWSNALLNKISIIKNKIDNIDDKDYNHSHKFRINDEFNSLINSVEYMRKELNSKEEYKNNMFQNISHELKTPITVINGYVEAANDKVITYKKAIDTIDKEIKVLSNEVNKILELNKINYLKDSCEFKNDIVDITELLTELVDKYKLQNKNINWELNINKENIVKGTYDIWKVILDNLFSNFIRYADKLIRITISDSKIEFYNDGDNIDENIIDDIFKQYKKGINGNFGLGLSIVKNSLELYNYNIKVINLDKGVLFIIE